MFSQVFVCPQRGICMMSLPVWLSGPMFRPGDLCSWTHVPSRGSLSGGALSRGRGSLSKGVSVRGLFVRRHPRFRKVGGMHPTGMLSCYNYNVLLLSMSTLYQFNVVMTPPPQNKKKQTKPCKS